MTNPSFGGSGARGGSAARDVASVWRTRLGADAARPFLTYLDETTGERVELSFTTFGNWLAKTGNLIQDDLTAGPGDRVAVSAAPHWLTAVWLVAPMLTSAFVDPWGEAKGAHTVVSGPDEPTLDAARACAGERLALSLLPLGRPFAQAPDGFRDYSAEVRGFGDRFASFTAPGPDTPALAAGGEVLTHAELVERASAAAVGLTGADRVLLDARRDAFTGAEAIEWLFAPLVAGAGVVVVRGATPERLNRIAETERTTRRLALD